MDTTEVQAKSNPLVSLAQGVLAPALTALGSTIAGAGAGTDAGLVDLDGPARALGKLGEALQQFPSGEALEAVRAGSSSVLVRVSYIDEELRVVRPHNQLPAEAGCVFAYRRRQSTSASI